jgi:RNA polymerase-interacting CarD/CdnL/TRCF family regulator
MSPMTLCGADCWRGAYRKRPTKKRETRAERRMQEAIRELEGEIAIVRWQQESARQMFDKALVALYDELKWANAALINLKETV